jgi:NADH dehydrogenase
MSGPKVIVAGATGYLGTRLLAHLPRERIAGTVVRRPRPSLPGIQWTFGPAGIEPAAPEATKGAVLFHFVGGGRGRRASDIYDINVRATEMLVDFARRGGVARIVYMSGFGVGGDSSSTYFQAKREAEAVIKASGIDHAILRCSYVLGGNDEFKPWLLSEIAAGGVHLPGSGDYRIQPVHVDDLMRCFAALAGAAGRLDAVYDFIGEPIAFRDFIARLLERYGADVPVMATPIEPFIRETVVTDAPTFSLDELAILLCDVVGPWTIDVAGVRPRSAEAAIAAIVAELRAPREPAAPAHPVAGR